MAQGHKQKRPARNGNASRASSYFEVMLSALAEQDKQLVSADPGHQTAHGVCGNGA